MPNPKVKVRSPQTARKMVYKQVALQPPVYDRLSDFCNKRESYNEAVARLLDLAGVPEKKKIIPKKKPASKTK